MKARAKAIGVYLVTHCMYTFTSAGVGGYEWTIAVPERL